MGEASLPSWVFPPVCCRCLAPAEVTHTVIALVGKAETDPEIRFDVPMCRACDARRRRRALIARVVLLALAASGVLLMTPLSPMPGGSTTLGATLTVLGVAGLAFVHLGRIFEPAAVRNGRPVFPYPAYQSRFDQANP